MVALLEGEGLAALCAGVRRLPCVHGCYGEHLNGICLNRYLCIFHLQVICVPKPKGATIYQNYAMHVSSIGQRERNIKIIENYSAITNILFMPALQDM